MSLILLYQNIQ